MPLNVDLRFPYTGSFTGSLAGNASTATALQTARAINTVNFDGTAPITITADAGTLTGTTLAAGITASSLTSVGTLATLTVTATIIGTVSGNAGTATALQTARAINGVNFDGTAAITVAAAAGTLTGATLAAGVTASSLTSIGTLAAGAVPASLITAGTFGTGAYTFPSTLTVISTIGASNFSGTHSGTSSGTNTGDQTTISGNAGTATALQTARAINGVNFDGTAAITVAAAAGTLTGATLAAGVTASSLTSVGTLATLTVTATIIGSVSGNAATATALQTTRAINGVNFDGTAAITVAAAAGTLTGATLAAGVTASSLTSVGTLASLTVTATITGSVSGNAATTSQRTFSNVRTDGINRGSYGSISIAGNTNGWAGIDFTDYSSTFMVTTSGGGGIYYNNAAWVWQFNSAGSLVVGTVPNASVVGLGTLATQNGTFSGTSSGTNTGDQTNISGNAATISNFTSQPSRIDGNDYSLAGRTQGIYAITGVGTNGPGTSYLNLIHAANGTDVAFQIAGGYVSDNMYFRGTSALQAGTGYTTWRTVLHSGNYTSYSPTLTGGSASGTWGINVTGTAGSISGFGNPTTAATGNTIVYRDASGYITNSYFYASGGGSERNTTGMGYFAGHNTSDYYYRSYTAQAAATLLSGTTMNIVGSSTSCSGNAATASAVAASALTGATLAAGVTASSLTSVGTLTSLTLGGSTDFVNNQVDRAKFKSYSEIVGTPAISSGALTLDLSTANTFRVSKGAAVTTLTISNPPGTGIAGSFTLIFDTTGSFAVTWPASVHWAGGTAPTLSTVTSKTDILTFITTNAGTTWYGFVSGLTFVT